MLLEDNALVKIQNRDNGYVGYTIPDLNGLHRSFSPGETKEITMNELRKLSYIPGGMKTIKDCFIILNEAARAEILPDIEPEYYLDKDGVTDLLVNGSLDQLLDCLDFAPEGVISLVKDIAVNIELNDIRKREAILQKTGFNVTRAIEINKDTLGEEDKEVKPVRRTAITSATEAPEGRRAGIPTYKVVKK